MAGEEHESLFDILFGHTLHEWSTASFPLARDVMRVFFKFTEDGKPIIESARLTARKLRAHWLWANESVLREDAVFNRIRRLYSRYDVLRKSYGGKKANKTSFDRNLSELQTELDQELNIRSKVICKLTRKEKRHALAVAEGRRRRRFRRKRNEQDSNNYEGSSLESDDSTSSEEFNPSEDSSDESQTAQSNLGPINCDELMHNLDRAKISSRAAFRTLASFSKTYKLNLKSLHISRTSLRRKRAKARHRLAMSIQETFQPSVPLTVHWDGIRVKALTGRTNVERLPVIVTGKDTDQMLGASIIACGTGQAQADMVCGNLRDWKCEKQVSALCSDTTASNTGYSSGAAVLIEKSLGRKLLYLACRHHLLEIIPKHLFDELVETSTSPDLGTICRRFEKTWPSINHNMYSPGTEDEELARVLTPETVDEIVTFAKQKLEGPHIRGDYKYLLELVIIFLGESPPSGVHFRPPMALSSARFMGRIIYCLTIYMFARAGQFDLEPHVLYGIREVNVFAVTTYLEPWFTATDPVAAPLTDLMLLQNIISYSAISPVTSECALKAFQGHFWYLSEECGAFGFFDPRVSVETKRKMVQQLSVPRKQTAKSRQRYLIDKNFPIERLLDVDLSFFVSKNTINFFEIMGISRDFLAKDPANWDSDPSFLSALEIVRALQPVNDVAERGVALVKSYNENVTNNEAEFQKLLLVCRKLIMDESDKSINLSSYLNDLK